MKKRFVVVCAFAASAAALAFGQDGPAPTDKAAPERPQITETKPESEAKLPPKWDRESMPPRERQFERGDKGPRGEFGRRGPQGAPDRGFRGDMRKGDGPREGKMGANGNGPKDFKGPREDMQGREGKGPKNFNGPREGMRGHEGKGPKDFNGPREGMQGREGKGPKDFNGPREGMRGHEGKGPKDFNGPHKGMQGHEGKGPKDFNGPREGMRGHEGKGPKDFNGPREGMRGHEGKGPAADVQTPEGNRPNPKEAQAPEEAQDGNVIKTEERRMERMDRRGGRPDGFEGRRGSHGDASPERKVQELQVSPEA